MDKNRVKGDNEPTGLRRLTGKGGVALVMFHLARQKIEFAPTQENSHLGDLWISVDGKKYGLEVKTCRSIAKWQIKASQINRVDFYVLVSMETAHCFIFTSEEMTAIVLRAPVIYGDIHLVNKTAFEAPCMNAWSKFSVLAATTIPDIIRGGLVTAPRRIGVENRRPKTVRKTLADGTVKTYSYRRV